MGARHLVAKGSGLLLWPLQGLQTARGTLFGWVPVLLGLGIGGWFALLWVPGAGFYLAGTNYARVTPNGELTPCPYMPLTAGNVREASFVDLWERSDVFNSFRYPQLKGKCGDCEYTDICGGCRARPYVDHGDWLDEDQWCLYTPKGGEKIKVAFNTPEETAVAWDEASELRLSRIPYFLRAMVKKGVNGMPGKMALL